MHDKQLYKGVFWIVNEKNIEKNKVYCFKIPFIHLQEHTFYFFKKPIYIFGKPGSDLYLNSRVSSKKGNNLSHKKTWNIIRKSLNIEHDYSFYPRGRIEIIKDKAKIILEPRINKGEIISFLVNEYNLTEQNGISVIKITEIKKNL